MEQLYAKGINNNLMVAPPNSAFVEQLNVKAQAELDRLDNNYKKNIRPDGRFTPDQRLSTDVAAKVTGPKVVMDLIKERVGKSATDASIGRQASRVRDIFDSRAKNISKIQWVTEASDHDASTHQTPTGAQDSTHQTPASAQDSTHQTPTGAQDSTHQTPTGAQDSTHQTPAGAQDSTHQTPASAQDSTHQTPTGAQDSTHQTPTVEERCQ